jgi:hypothetical protein
MALLQEMGEAADRLRLQKLLFLLSKEQQKQSFYFLPYKYGAFSFQANADLHTMQKYELVTASEHGWKSEDETPYLPLLNKQDQKHLKAIIEKFGRFSNDDLLHYTYSQHPYYAINSEVRDRYLSEAELQMVAATMPASITKKLYTIGYEGISLEQYINRLIINGIAVLCDVRRNAFSMKYGFNKSQLQMACEGVGIEYVHIRELGIPSDKRTQLETQEDYDQLFAEYQTTLLQESEDYQKKVLSLIESKGSVALTCFEAEICQCHRKPLAEKIAQLPGFQYEIKHI